MNNETIYGCGIYNCYYGYKIEIFSSTVFKGLYDQMFKIFVIYALRVMKE